MQFPSDDDARRYIDALRERLDAEEFELRMTGAWDRLDSWERLVQRPADLGLADVLLDGYERTALEQLHLEEALARLIAAYPVDEVLAVA